MSGALYRFLRAVEVLARQGHRGVPVRGSTTDTAPVYGHAWHVQWSPNHRTELIDLV